MSCDSSFENYPNTIVNLNNSFNEKENGLNHFLDYYKIKSQGFKFIIINILKIILIFIIWVV